MGGSVGRRACRTYGARVAIAIALGTARLTPPGAAPAAAQATDLERHDALQSAEVRCARR